MGEVLPQGNPPKSLRGQPRTPVRLRVHEKAGLSESMSASPSPRNEKVTMLARSVGCRFRNTYASGRWDMNRADIRPRRYLMCWIRLMKWQKAVNRVQVLKLQPVQMR